MRARALAIGALVLALTAACTGDGSPEPSSGPTGGSSTPTSAPSVAAAKNGRIAFRRYLDQSQSRSAIFTINPDGTGERQVTHPKRGEIDFQVNWSPDGRWLAYQRQNGPLHGEGDLFKIRADGTHRTYLSTTCTDSCAADLNPFWSPDGTQISFSRWFSTLSEDFQAVFVMQADGTHLRQVTQLDAPTDQVGFRDGSPAWSPDGDGFVFERFDPKREAHAIFTVRLDGTSLERITPWGLDAAEPDWSPDGRWIAFRTQEQSDLHGDIGLVQPSGKGLHIITSGHGKWFSCSFSPDGKRITAGYAPGYGDAGNADIYTMNVDGTGLRAVTHTILWESAADWGPRP